MDMKNFASALAQTIGTERGIVEAEHKLMNDGQLEVGMKRQLQEIYIQDEAHLQELESALDEIGRPENVESDLNRGRRICSDILNLEGQDPLGFLKATILAKYSAVDSLELFYGLCDELGQGDMCNIFEEALEDNEDHLDYMREQAILMARERITGVAAT